MDTLDYWTPQDALSFRCSPEEVGTLRPAAPLPVIAGERPDITSARLYADRAMRALARLAEGEGKVALEAARTILDRAYGPALPQVPERPALPQDAGDPRALPAPSWYDPEARHQYKALDD